MGVKTKPVTDTKINIEDWKAFFSAAISGNGLATQEYANKIVKLLHSKTLNHLICKECNRVLPDENFYRQVSQNARRYKSQSCKECWGMKYRG